MTSLLAREPVVRGPGGLFARDVSCRARRRCGRPWGTCGEPRGAGVGSLEGKLVEAKWRAEIEWVSRLALYTMYLVSA